MSWLSCVSLRVAPLFFLALIAPPARADDTTPPANPVWPVPTQVPAPSEILNVTDPILPLTNWKSKPAPQGEFWANGVDTSTWSAAGGRGGRGGGGRGGGGAASQPASDYSAAYRTEAAIPADWAGHRVVIRFNGVAGGARLWINGVQIRDHWGPLMPFTADITDHVTPGQTVNIALGVNERGEGLNAFVRGGGIQRDAMLIAEPADYLARVNVETEFDRQYINATLRVHLTMNFFAGDSANVRLTFRDPKNNDVPLAQPIFKIARTAADQVFAVPFSQPMQWDAEHPNLYTLEADVIGDDNIPKERITRTFGFRQVEVRGNQVFVNGKEIKLRGIWGMNSVAQIKALNANHTRQKWVTDQFLDDADRLGLYVLDEDPVDFAKYGVEIDPQYAYQWLEMISDLMERDWNHPSVMMWGLGNESLNGPNILKMFKYSQAQDHQRPSIFSFANRVPVDQELPYSVYSSHYPNLTDPNLNLGDYDVAKWHSTSLVKQRNPLPVMPVLHDEYSHVVLNQDLLNRDPNVRNFWGESIYNYWEKMFVTQGALGGDIFGFGGGFGGAGGQGIEHYLTHEAYSPIRIANEPLANPGGGKLLGVPIKNWFDHTNLNELTVHWAVGSEKGDVHGPDVGPHAAGVLEIPARDWKDGDKLSLKFSLSGAAANAPAIDEFLLAVNPPAVVLPVAQGPAPKLEETARDIVITGPHFKVVFNKYKGLISSAAYDGKTVLIDGPYLDLLGSGLAYGEWWCDSIAAHTDGNEVVVDIKGNYAVIQAAFHVRIDGQGLITTQYTIPFIPGNPPPPTFSPWNANSVGGYSEVGVSYMLPANTASLTWRRKGLWSIYPPDHIGRIEGTGKAGSDDFRGTKENFYEAMAMIGPDGPAAVALSDGHDSVRLSADPGYRVLPAGIRMGIHNEWNYPDIGLGDFAKPPIAITSGYSNTVYLKLSVGKP